MANIRVLIVDDVQSVRDDLRVFLALAGDIEIVGEATNGLEAVGLMKELCPQVVLMDLEMPVMDGYEATRQIKITNRTCKVIILSIHADKEKQERAQDSGADVFIVKGASLEILMEAIHNAPALGQMPKGEST